MFLSRQWFIFSARYKSPSHFQKWSLVPFELGGGWIFSASTLFSYQLVSIFLSRACFLLSNKIPLSIVSPPLKHVVWALRAISCTNIFFYHLIFFFVFNIFYKSVFMKQLNINYPMSSSLVHIAVKAFFASILSLISLNIFFLSQVPFFITLNKPPHDIVTTEPPYM